MISGVLSSVLPIMVTIGIGILCNKINLLSRNGTGELPEQYIVLCSTNPDIITNTFRLHHPNYESLWLP